MKKMKQLIRNPQLKGMTLTELLIVMAILGILLLLAFPVLKPLLARTHAMEAKTNLRHLAELQKVYYMEHSNYATDFEQLGFEQAALVSDGKGTAHYQIEISNASTDNFVATATSVTDFDGDGVLNQWEITKDGIPHELRMD